jgi:hypothetical protein
VAQVDPQANPRNCPHTFKTATCRNPVVPLINEILGRCFQVSDPYATADAVRSAAHNARPYYIHPAPGADCLSNRGQTGALCVKSCATLQELNVLYYGCRNIIVHGNPFQTIEARGGALRPDPNAPYVLPANGAPCTA